MIDVMPVIKVSITSIYYHTIDATHMQKANMRTNMSTFTGGKIQSLEHGNIAGGHIRQVANHHR